GLSAPTRRSTTTGRDLSLHVAPSRPQARRLLVLQRKRDHGRRARLIVTCACDGERTNRDNESGDNGEYDLSHRVSPFYRGPCLQYDRGGGTWTHVQVGAILRPFDGANPQLHEALSL